MSERDPAEEIAELLGEPLPSDWRSPLAVQARAEHLAALAYTTADAARALLMHHANNGRVKPNDAPVEGFVDSIIELERGVRTYGHNTQRNDGPEIVYAAVALRLGATGADWIASAIEGLRAQRIRCVAEQNLVLSAQARAKAAPARAKAAS